MRSDIVKLGYLAGIVTPFWLILGVAFIGSLYPGYSHLNQAMSELGAVGSPTETISPFFNNYPLGVLFVLFGLAIFKHYRFSLGAVISGVLIIVHGLAEFLAGIISCDVGCNPEVPSSSQLIHELLGMVMFITLITANIIWVFVARKIQRNGLSWFSLLCTVTAIVAVPLMFFAMESNEGFGLFQRINYGASAVWVGVLAFVLMRIPDDEHQQEIQNEQFYR